MSELIITNFLNVINCFLLVINVFLCVKVIKRFRILDESYSESLQDFSNIRSSLVAVSFNLNHKYDELEKRIEFLSEKIGELKEKEGKK